MALQFAPGDDLIFQLESGYGLLRVLAVEERAGEAVSRRARKIPARRVVLPGRRGRLLAGE